MTQQDNEMNLWHCRFLVGFVELRIPGDLVRFAMLRRTRCCSGCVGRSTTSLISGTSRELERILASRKSSLAPLECPVISSMLSRST